MKKYLTREEAMEHLRLSNTQFWRLTKGGKLPYYQDGPGARMMFLEEDLDRYMDSTRVGASGKARTVDAIDPYGTYRKRRVTA